MTDKIDVVYIGPKPVKRLAVQGVRYVFPRLKPVPLPRDAAYILLEHDTVFSEKDEAETVAKAQEEKAAKEEARKVAAEKAEKQEAAANSFVVIIDGEQRDISKATSAKLKTIIEAEDLDIVSDNVQVSELRERVRLALHEKYGNPELED